MFFQKENLWIVIPIVFNNQQLKIKYYLKIVVVLIVFG